MVDNVSTAKVPVAAVKRRKHDVSYRHVTTSSFMNFDCIAAKELVPNTHLIDVHKCFIRTLPLVNPTLGSIKGHSRAFFVPFRVVWQPFNSFINDVPYNSSASVGLIPNVPLIYADQIFRAIDSQAYDVTSSDSYDYSYSEGGVIKYKKLTSIGRWFLKFLRSLGYQFIPTDYDNGNDPLNPAFSALPLLCALKVYLDYYFPSNYSHTNDYATLDAYFHKQSTYSITSGELVVILGSIRYVSYENSIFTTAWDRPVGPNALAGSIDFVLDDITLYNNSPSNRSRVIQSAVGVPNVQRADGQSVIPASFSQYTDDALKSLNDYVKRHQLAGSRVLQRALAEFGVSLSVEKLQRSVYLGSDDYVIQIGDVMSTAETSDASLGSYAGKAIGYSQGHTFECDTDEFGYYLVFNSLIPDVAYTDGYDYNATHISKLDFFTPEFDMLGVRMLERGEVLGSMQYVPANPWNNLKQRFGFVPRYAEYRTGRDLLTGDFAVPSMSLDLEGWYTSRQFDYSAGGNAWVLSHNLDFMIGTDSTQFLRLFGVDVKNLKDPNDPFYCVHMDNIVIDAPMKHLYDSYEFDNEENASKTITTDNGGARLN